MTSHARRGAEGPHKQEPVEPLIEPQEDERRWTKWICPICSRERLNPEDWCAGRTAAEVHKRSHPVKVEVIPATLLEAAVERIKHHEDREKGAEYAATQAEARLEELERLLKDAAHVVAREGFFSSVSGQEEFWANVGVALGVESDEARELLTPKDTE